VYNPYETSMANNRESRVHCQSAYETLETSSVLWLPLPTLQSEPQEDFQTMCENWCLACLRAHPDDLSVTSRTKWW
jgi:hypothetical protein